MTREKWYVAVVLGFLIVMGVANFIEYRSNYMKVHAQGYVSPPPPLGTLQCNGGVAPTWQHGIVHFKGKETQKGLDMWMCVETFEELDKE